tara:strand:- start:3192 stop:4709 length:1518 start_codon:yes stop_codon:yes gene_type:complete
VTKILSNINELKKKIYQLKKQRKKIALVHGVFDLIHLGHIEHFKEAKKNGDILIATVTSDRFVKKGFNKPYFDEGDRCSFLASLTTIDYVFCNDFKHAEKVIKIIKPTFYVKGPDYLKKSGDVAGYLTLEKNALNKFGGKLMFTTGQQLSSTKIINDNFQNLNKKDNQYLKSLKKNTDSKIIVDEFRNVLKKSKNQKILVIGEIIIDEYLYSSPQGQPAKENILAVNFEKQEVFFGGVLPLIKNISQFCKNVTLATIYQDDSIKNKIYRHFPKSVKLKLFKNKEFVDVRKKRYVNLQNFSKIFEAYHFINKDFNDEKFKKFLIKNVGKYDHVIVCDFGHGLINSNLANFITKKAKFVSANIQTNSGNRGYNLFTKYKKLDFLCIDEPELRLGLSDKNTKLDTLINSLNKKKYKNIMLTQGARGLSLKQKNKKILWLPAAATDLKDTIGAGDAAFSFASCFVRNSKNEKLISIVAALSAAIKVGIIGHRKHIEIDNLFKSLISYLK